MGAPEGWQINPDWPSDTAGIVGYFHDEKSASSNKTLFVVGTWRFFLGGEGDVQVFPFRRGGVLVIVGGQSYIVQPESENVLLPDLWSIDLRSSTYVASHDIVVSFANFGASVVAFGPDGVLWQNRSSDIDYTESFAFVDGTLRIKCPRAHGNDQGLLVIDLASGEEIATSDPTPNPAP
jgi:hypothetical protein